MKTNFLTLVFWSLNLTFLYSQEFCDTSLPQCYQCDAETDEDLEVEGYENSSYLVKQLFVKVNSNLLQNINTTTADFGNVTVNNFSDSYGLESIERMGDSDYYELTFRNIKNLQCTIDGYYYLVDEVAQSSYFEAVSPEISFESSSQQTDDSSSPSNNSPESSELFVNPNASFFYKQWYLRNTDNPLADIDARRAWKITQGSNNVEVYLLDGFFNYTTEKNRVNQQVYIARDKELTNNPINYPELKEVNDIFHGEADLAIYGSRGLNQNASISGIDWNSSINLIEIVDLLYSYDNLDNKLGRYGIPSTSDYISTMEHLTSISAEKNINVINLSFGSFENNNISSMLLQFPLINFMNTNDNTLFIVAANDFNREINDGDFPSSSNSTNILVVGGSDENDDHWETDDNFGSGFGTSMSVVAPSNNIYGPIGSLGLGNWAGNSMAAPIVSGIASLIYSLEHIESNAKKFTALEVKDMIITTAEKYMFDSAVENTDVNENQLGIISYPVQRDEKLANGRVNAHQAVLLSSAHLNHYRGDNPHILRETDNRDLKSFTIPFDKVLFDEYPNTKYALMLNRHKFSTYQLPKANQTGALIWESQVDLPAVINDFDNLYAKELKLIHNKLSLINLQEGVNWSVDLPDKVQYLDFGNDNNARQCKIVETPGVNVKEVCTTKNQRDEHNELGLDRNHYYSQKLALDPNNGDLMVIYGYKNIPGEIEEFKVWSSSEGNIDHKENAQRHLYEDYYTTGCLNEKVGNFLSSGEKLEQNECMYSADRNYRVILLDNKLVTQQKIIDDDGHGEGQIIYEDVTNFSLN